MRQARVKDGMTGILMVKLEVIHVEMSTQHLKPGEDSEHLVD